MQLERVVAERALRIGVAHVDRGEHRRAGLEAQVKGRAAQLAYALLAPPCKR